MKLQSLAAALILLPLAWLPLGCANPAGGGSDSKGPITEWDLTLDSLPEDQSRYYVVVQSYSVSDSGKQTNYDSIELGWMKPTDRLRKQITVDTNAQYLSAYLLPEGYEDPKYFNSWDLTVIDDPQLGGLYWLDYSAWVYNEEIRFGMNTDYQQDMALETDVTLDFSDRPFYVLKAPKGTGQTYRFRYHDNQGTSVDVKYASTWASATSSWGQQITADTSFSIPTTDTGMVVVRPISYSGETRPEAVYRTHNATEDIAAEKARTFPVNAVASVDGGQTLYLTAGDTWGPQKELRQWVVGEPYPTIASTFTDPIRAIKASGSDLYVGTGNSLYRYRPATGESKLLWNFAGSVSAIAPLGTTHLVVFSGSSGVALVRLNEFTVLDSVSRSYSSSKENVWIPEQGRLYLYRDGISPNDLCYFDIDLETGKLGAYGDSPYHVEYSIGGKLLRMGTQNVLATGGGYLFRCDDTTDPSKIKYWTSLPSGFEGLVMGETQLTVLEAIVKDWSTTGSRVRTLDAAAPFAPTATKGEWPGELPVDLIATGSGAVAVTKTSQNLVSLHVLSNTPAAAPTASFQSLRRAAAAGRYLPPQAFFTPRLD